MSNRKTLKEFIRDARNIYGYKYNYNQTEYISNKHRMIIICKKHGPFSKTPNAFLRGSGCPKCGRERAAREISLTQKEFLERAEEIHGNKYDYSLVKYKNKAEKVIIVCKTHGKFKQIAGNHFNGAGCKKCAVKLEGKKRRISMNNLLEQFRKVHGQKYDYSRITYKNTVSKVEIICKKHGKFWQTPVTHKKGSGCPVCRQSKAEQFIGMWLDKNKIDFVRQKKFKGCKNVIRLPFDFYIPKINTCIEYDGELHYKSYNRSASGDQKLKQTKNNDKIKTKFCNINNIALLRIPYWKKGEIQEILTKNIKNVIAILILTKKEIK